MKASSWIPDTLCLAQLLYGPFTAVKIWPIDVWTYVPSRDFVYDFVSRHI